MKMDQKNLSVACAALIVAMAAGCSNNSSMSPTTTTPTPTPSVVSQLKTTTTIGSTVDAANGDNNPYGLAIAPVTAGSITAGDLIVCNFNNKAGVSAAGTTIEDLSPMAGSMPKRIAQDASLAGCDSLALNGASDFIWVAAYTANDNPIFKPTGTLATTLATSFKWMQPWGQIYAAPSMSSGITANPAFYITDAGNGSIVASSITSTGLVFTTIATGFPTNLASKYGILAPAGLTYDPNTDTLYIVSSANNSIIAFSKVSTIPNNGITVTATATSPGVYGSTAASTTFGGPAASQAKVIFAGTPLNYPVSAALLYNGDLIVGNTGDNNMVEINPATSTMIDTKSVDTGNVGAIFGIATSGTTLATQKVYFNDDNTNTVVGLSQ